MMNIVTTVVRTNTDSPKIDCAGVEAGAKILVGLAECPVESASTEQGAQARTVQRSNLMCEPLMRSILLTVLGCACLFPETSATRRPVSLRLAGNPQSQRVRRSRAPD